MMKTPLIILLTYASVTFGWEDDRVIAYILAHQPVLKAQNHLTEVHRPGNALQSLQDNTRLIARMGGLITPLLGAEDNAVVASHSQGATAYGGISISIPLGSSGERQALAKQTLLAEEAEQHVLGLVLQDLMQLHQVEGELLETRDKLEFTETQLGINAQRLDAGLIGYDQISNVAAQLIELRSRSARLAEMQSAWRHKISRYAGPVWKNLLAYLAGNEQALGITHEPP